MAAWFRGRGHPPAGEVRCPELTLRADFMATCAANTRESGTEKRDRRRTWMTDESLTPRGTLQDPAGAARKRTARHGRTSGYAPPLSLRSLQRLPCWPARMTGGTIVSEEPGYDCRPNSERMPKRSSTPSATPAARLTVATTAEPLTLNLAIANDTGSSERAAASLRGPDRDLLAYRRSRAGTGRVLDPLRRRPDVGFPPAPGRHVARRRTVHGARRGLHVQ